MRNLPLPCFLFLAQHVLREPARHTVLLVGRADAICRRLNRRLGVFHRHAHSAAPKHFNIGHVVAERCDVFQRYAAGLGHSFNAIKFIRAARNYQRHCGFTRPYHCIFGQHVRYAFNIAGFNAVFHDRDDGVANYFAALSPGLSPFKNPSLFRRIRLTE